MGYLGEVHRRSRIPIKATISIPWPINHSSTTATHALSMHAQRPERPWQSQSVSAEQDVLSNDPSDESWLVTIGHTTAQSPSMHIDV